jgi:GDP-L-fucose synthase
LKNTVEVDHFFSTEKPEYVFLAAAKVGGILANNNYPADFLYDNLMIQNNVIEASFRHGVKKLLFLGSSCIYPKMAPQPIHEESLLSGYLEPTNEAYAIAKIAGIKLCQAYFKQHGRHFISAMPTNLWAWGQLSSSELACIPALLRRFHEARNKEVGSYHLGYRCTVASLCSRMIWGRLPFHMLNHDKPDIINVGTGEEVSILDLAHLIAETVGFRGRIGFDKTKPDGTPRKLMDSGRLHAMGFRHKTSLKEGIKITYQDFLTKIPALTVND